MCRSLVRLGAVLFALSGGVAAAQPAPVDIGSFAPYAASGISVGLQPLFTVPADATAGPLARIQYVTSLADGRMFTNNINGSLFVNTAGTAATPYLQLQNQNVGLTVGPDPNGPGFMGVAFHPNFDGDPTQPGYGVFYTETTIANTGTPAPGVTTIGNTAIGGTQLQIREWTATDPTASTFSGTSRVVLDIAGYVDNHSGGTIAFNPTAAPGSADYGNLYIGSGDGLFNDGNQNAQNLGVPQGKMLRINPLQSGDQPFTIPAGNMTGSGTLPEIWAYGLRYPQSFGWDRATGRMYINDLGQAELEEVDVGIAGANYGWSQREGTYATGYAYGLGSGDQNIYPVPTNSAGLYTDPIAQYDHNHEYALGSGFVYHGSLIPALDGLYVMQDIVTGDLLTFNPDVTAGTLAPVSTIQVVQDGQDVNLRDTLGYDSWLNGPRTDCRLSESGSGELLDACKATGTVYQLVAADVSATDVPEPGSLALVAVGLLLAVRGRLAGRRLN
jgi:glucose/arabinose dehydrogenase